MIYLTRLDGSEFVVNAEHLQYVERTPDTVLTLTSGARVMVKEEVREVVERFIAYRQRIVSVVRVLEQAPREER